VSDDDVTPIDVTAADSGTAVDTAAAAAAAEQERAELMRLAAATATDVRAYVESVTTVASGTSPDVALPIVLLAVAQVLATGARLGAITDVVPSERFEPDSGPEPDVDPLRVALANVFEGLDDYAEVFDPLVDTELAAASLSGDLAVVAADLSHGMRHFEAGRVDEALWWWQFSFLSSWGPRAASALRVVVSILGHLRTDADDEAVTGAAYDALHR